MDQTAVVRRHVEVVSPCADSHAQEGHGASSANVPGWRRSGRWAVLWGLSGTILSGVGFVCLALFEQYNHAMTELQRDLKHFNEISGELVKKDSMQRCYTKVADCIKELEASAACRTQLEKELDNAHKDRRDVERELQRVRERLAAVEGRQSVTPIIVQTTPERK